MFGHRPQVRKSDGSGKDRPLLENQHMTTSIKPFNPLKAMRPDPLNHVHSWLGKALLGSASLVLASGLLNTSAAQAAGWTPNGPPVTGYLCDLNDLLCFNPAAPVDSPVVGDKFVTLLNRSTTIGVNTDVVEFTQDSGDINTPWHLTLDFNPNRGFPGDNGFLDYQITITDPDQWFDEVKLSNTSSITSGDYTLTKNFYTDSTYTTPLINTPLFNPPGPAGITLANLQLQTLFVRDTWTVAANANGVVDNIQNTFGQTNGVPGPLPLLGLGAGFGLSRRLRRRIKGGVML